MNSKHGSGFTPSEEPAVVWFRMQKKEGLSQNRKMSFKTPVKNLKVPTFRSDWT